MQLCAFVLLHTESWSTSIRKPEKVAHISYPCGVAISQEGHLIVAEWSRDCITILDTTSGEKIDELGQYGSKQLEFDRPEGP